MDKEKFKQALETVLAEKGSKKFNQTVDIIINLKEIDLKKNDQQVDFFLQLPKSKGKTPKICGLVGPELLDESKSTFDKTIEAHDFENFKGKNNEIKKLAESYDYFVAQATIMPQIASAFGRILGSRGKMPNPKAGCIMPPKAQLSPVKDRLATTVRVMAKSSSSVKLPIGTESQSVDEIAENAVAIYQGLVNHTPQAENNIKNISLKLTMGKPVKVE